MANALPSVTSAPPSMADAPPSIRNDVTPLSGARRWMIDARPSMAGARPSTPDTRPSITNARRSIANDGPFLGGARALSLSERAVFVRAALLTNAFETFRHKFRGHSSGRRASTFCDRGSGAPYNVLSPGHIRFSRNTNPRGPIYPVARRCREMSEVGHGFPTPCPNEGRAYERSVTQAARDGRAGP